MEIVHELLTRRFILRKESPELYFKVKDRLPEFKEFFREKLGYQLIVNPVLIKVEKLPGKEQVWMGIQAFDSPVVYGVFTLVLMYLEELTAEEQFVLSQVTDYIQQQCPENFKIDWTLFRHRQALIKAMRFCVEEGLILLSDGDDSGFTSNLEEVAVLYENTGASKYFMRRFSVDINRLDLSSDLESFEWQGEERDRGLMRRHRVYRRLVMEPVVYDTGKDDQDYLYIKNQRSVIAHDLDKYLNAQLHLHLNGAIVLLSENIHHSECLPNRKNISDIVLQFCSQLRLLMINNEDEDINDTISIVQWDHALIKLKDCYGLGWSKKYREMGLKALRDEILYEMVAFGLVRPLKTGKEIRLLPAIGKMIGDYPKDYKEGKTSGDMATQ